MIKTLTDENYERILKEERIAVVKVYAPWCGPCKFMKSHYEKWSNQFVTYQNTPVTFFEIENDKNKKFVEEHKIESLPTLVFFIHGAEVGRIKGMTRVSVFEENLKKSLSFRYEYIPN